MSTNQVIETLRQATAKNKVVDAVMHVCAMRERARYNLTINGLMQRMKAEGFTFSVQEYQTVIKLLADLGFGQLDRDHKGRIVGIKGLKNTLQSIGVAACGKTNSLKEYKQRHKFTHLVSVGEKTRVSPPSAPIKEMVTPNFISIVLPINGKQISIQLPENLSEAEIAGLLTRFRDKSVA